MTTESFYIPERSVKPMNLFVMGRGPTILPKEFLDHCWEAYSELHRVYHASWHILDIFSRASNAGVVLSLNQITAIFGHDVTYWPDVPKGFNEASSVAELAKFDSLFAAQYDPAEVFRIILDTVDHVPTCEASKVVLDLDLAGFADSYEEFLNYGELIWQEVRNVLPTFSRETFDAKRKEFLAGFLNRGRIYHSEHFAHLEPLARANISQYINN